MLVDVYPEKIILSLNRFSWEAIWSILLKRFENLISSSVEIGAVGCEYRGSSATSLQPCSIPSEYRLKRPYRPGHIGNENYCDQHDNLRVSQQTWCSLTMPCAIQSPKPTLPSPLRSRPLNRSKSAAILSCSSAAKPLPESHTWNRSIPTTFKSSMP